jgi:hypothetical protein
MGINPSRSRDVSPKIVKEIESGHWPVYRTYCAVGPAGVVKCTGVDGQEVIQRMKKEVFQPKEERDTYVMAVDSTEDTQQAGIGGTEFSTLYSPLSVPELFLEFAELADKKVTIEVMLDWISRYGVLGLEDVGGGPNENLQNFASEARKANYLLRTYEAVTAPDGPHAIDHAKVAYLAGVRPSVRTTALPADASMEEKVVAMVADIVRDVVTRECSPELYRTEHEYVRGWGFESLLGAMYLQMMQLMTSKEVRRCKGPDCWRIIDFKPGERYAGPGMGKNLRGKYKTRKDKQFCSTNCRVKWRYHNVIKPRRVSKGVES